jgi:VanZ family protein
VLPPDRISPSPAGRQPAPAAGTRSSPLARATLLACVVLLVYGSLSPWQGWRSLGVSPFAFLFAPWPSHVTAFDLTLNVLAYAPLGTLLVLALYPRVRGIPALAAALACAAALSIVLEALQTYLPARIASNLDVLTNVAGAGLGGTAGVLLAPALVGRGKLQQARRRWFRPDATALLLLVALWPLAQIHPAPMLFGNGELPRDLVAAFLGLFGSRLPVFDASQFAAAEALVTATGLLGAGMALTAGMKRHAPRLRLLLLLCVAAMVTKAITYGHQFGPERALAWLTPGAVSGLAVGLLAAAAATSTTPPRLASVISAAALVVLLVAVNAVPPNPYHAHWLAAWQPGRLRDVAAASDWLAQAWPYALLAVLLWSQRRGPTTLRQSRGH